MTLSDPTSGSGWSFGEVLASADLNTIALQQPDALDGAAGGSYTPSSAITVNGSGMVIGGSGLSLNGVLDLSVGSDISDTNNQTIDPADGTIQRFADTTGARDHDLVSAGNSGRLLLVMAAVRDSPEDITIRRSGYAGNYIVQLPYSAWCWAILYDDGTNWRLGAHEGCTVGTDA